MSTSKIAFNLKGIPHTLLLPLIGRVIASKDENVAFRDERATQLLDSLHYDFDELMARMIEVSVTQEWAAIRAIYFDNEIKSFLQKHPDGAIVNLGAGLETSFHRVDNGILNWIDLDVPEVIDLRNQLLPPGPRVHHLAKSVLDHSWITDVKKTSSPVFMFAGGLFMYLAPQDVKSLFVTLSQELKGSELVFDCINDGDLPAANEWLTHFKFNDVSFKWGIDVKEVESWSPHIKVLYHRMYSTHGSKLTADSDSMFGYMTKLTFV